MQRVRPVRMSATETAAVWVRWRRGGSISEIGRAMDRSPGSIFYQLATHGGISPVPRTRSWRALTLHDREEISRGLASGRSLRAISAGLGRAPSTISREVQRHGGRAQYRPAAADVCTWYRARRPKPCRLATSAALRALVAAKLAADWSPQQIAGWLKQTFPDQTRPSRPVPSFLHAGHPRPAVGRPKLAHRDLGRAAIPLRPPRPAAERASSVRSLGRCARFPRA